MTDSMSLATQGGGTSIQSLEQMSRPMQRQTTREIEFAAKRAIVANVHEQARAQLAQDAMINAGMLAMLHDQLLQLAPFGADAYQAIGTAYVIGASKQLMQW